MPRHTRSETESTQEQHLDTTESGSTVSKASTPAAKKANAVWTAADDSTLVDHLEAALQKGDMGDNGFKAHVWKAAAEKLANPMAGGPKTIAGCRDHWTKALVKDYNAIAFLVKQVSGFGWDDDRKVVTADDDVWKELIETRPDLRKWRSKSFPLYDRVSAIISGKQATGQDTVRIGAAPHAAPAVPLASVTDNEGTPSQFASNGSSPSPKGTPRTPVSRHHRRSFSDSDSSISAPRGRKRDRSPSSSPVPTSSIKPRRVTGPMAVQEMAGAVAQMASSLGNASTAIATPTRRSKAVSTVAEDSHLSASDRVRAIKLFTTDIALCDSYLAISDKELRNAFLMDVIESS